MASLKAAVGLAGCPGSRAPAFNHLGLTIHESIGHSTELDRALGYEANYAGTSFLTPDKLGKFRVGSDIVNFNGDRIRPESLSTCGYDDDGVKTRQFPIIKAGIFVGYQTIRDQAYLIGQPESMGCCYADSYARRCRSRGCPTSGSSPSTSR